MASDLIMYQWGEEQCKPSHFYGPAVRDHYLIHYILDGKGRYEEGKNRYILQRGQGFLICPDVLTYYQADEEEPWHYVWVGFNGLQAQSYLSQCGLSRERPILNYDCQDEIQWCFKKMMESKQYSWGRENYLLGYLHLLFSYLIQEAHRQGHEILREEEGVFYIKRAIDFIEKNYSRKMKIQDMADHIGLHRSYLYTLFKQELHRSPQEYLIQFRINKACELMKKEELPIGYIAHSVGYEDPLLFSKVFKKVMGKSPSQYRQELKFTRSFYCTKASKAIQ